MEQEITDGMQRKIDTLLIHGGISTDAQTGAVSIPIFLASTFQQNGLGDHKGYEYGRSGNPTRKALEALIADLEGGVAGFALASGMAALTTTLLLFKKEDTFIISNNVYGGTFRVLDKVFKNFGIGYKIVDTSDLNQIEENIDDSVKALIIETPANPLLTITDIRGAAELAKRHGILTIVDNTFMSPYLQRPLELGADIVLHSGTKYLGGHSDVISGLAVVRDPALAERFAFTQNAAGAVLEPFDSWLLMRGIKTLGVRMDRHMENAEYVVQFLKNHPGVEKLYYPGLPDAQGYEIHKKQASAPGGMISFVLSEEYDIDHFFRSIRVITLAESLGGVESLISNPARMTHASIPYDIRQKTGIVDNLVRISVGIEDKRDIVADLASAFGLAKKS